jgi:chemotaxis methyl-accepting protein methylase
MTQGLVGVYINQNRRVWNHLPDSVRRSVVGQIYGGHLNALVRAHSNRQQAVATFFLRNRPELELMRQVAEQKPLGADLSITIVACSKGAEVYSVAWTLRRARPDLNLKIYAIDISQEVVDLAQRGVYAFVPPDPHHGANRSADSVESSGVAKTTGKDQNAWIFERLSSPELAFMFDIVGDQTTIKPWLKEGICWICGDAGDPALASSLGPQDIVVANRFLCHMEPPSAEKCLRNVANLVKPGGCLFASGIDLEVRTKVARDLCWEPVPDMVKEIHEGDSSVLKGWPFEYWGLEPFSDSRPEWLLRYACVFRVGHANEAVLKEVALVR